MRAARQRVDDRSPLHVALDDFYDTVVNIQYRRMEAAKIVVWEVERKLKPKLTELLDIKYNVTLGQNWMYTGSAYEDLKVCNPDEFDIMLPFDMTKHLGKTHNAVGDHDGEHSPAYAFLYPAVEESKFSSEQDFGYVLDSRKIMKKFQSVLKQAENGADFHDIDVRIGTAGPAGKVEVRSLTNSYGGRRLKIDLVPAVWISHKYYVAKSDKYDYSEGAELKWRVSNSDAEKAAVESAGEEKRKVLKIAKAFCLLDAPLAVLDSYYLKTVFLHMLDKYKGHWTDTGKYFKLFLDELLRYLREKSLPMYLMPRHNLIKNFVNSTSLSNIIGRLGRLLRKGDEALIKLLDELK
ncbi:cyclic GMP-AMP synthase-like receptor 3 isoform X1 [Ptychodera flava]|uniref:cyclic GMP-AMP synthase-like receptor 3 isoform X1 n=1 Tax=Ptychodera flava TaxID=63121 RepID=UPI003969BE7F